MTPRIAELMEMAGYAAPEMALRAQRLSDLLIKDIMLTVAAHALSNDDATDVFTNLQRIYEQPVV